MKEGIHRAMFKMAVVLLTAAAWVLISVDTAQAQVECPPGFHFDRLSGTGCVQDDCGIIPESHFDSTGHCTCNEGYSPCFEPINEPGYDPAACFPFCPASRLTTCVSYLSTCPGEEPANTSTIVAVTEEEAPVETDEKVEEKSTSKGTTSTAKDLAKDLQKFLAGSDNPDLKSRDAAVAAAAAAAVMASWMAAQLAAGANIDDLKKAIEMVRGGDKTKSVPAPGSGKPVTVKQDAPVKVPGAPPSSLPEQKKSMPQKDPASTLHDKKEPLPPNDAKEIKLRKEIEKYQQMEKENEQAKKQLEIEHKSVSDTVRKLGSAFDAENITRCTDGIIEVGDTVIMAVKDVATLGQADTVEKLTKLVTPDDLKDFVYKKFQQDVFDAYRKDLIKELLKKTASAQDLTPEEFRDLLRKPVGGNKRLPGGAFKEIVMNIVKHVPFVGKLASKGYDYFEQIYEMVKENQDHSRNIDAILQQKKEQFSKQLDLETKIHDRYVDIKNAEYDRNKAEEALAEYLRSRKHTPGIPKN